MTYSRVRAWWFVGLLCLASVLSVIDRGIVNLVVDPLRLELGLTDVQIGALQGLAFGIIYALGGVVLGFWADHRNRRNLVVFGIAVWSIATLAAGLARGFGELFAARLIVGLGEAALSPAVASLVADMFEPDKRGRPMGFFLAAQSMANGLAITLTGVVIALASTGYFSGVGVLDGLTPWRITFVMFGAVGVVLAIAMFTCREPQRSTRSESADLAIQAGATFRYCFDRWRFFLPLYLGFAFCFTAVYGAAGWTPTMLIRVFDFDAARLASFLGPWTIGFAIVGPLLGSAIVDPIARRYGDHGRLFLASFVVLLALPSGLAVYAPSGESAAILVASKAAAIPFVGLCVITTLQSQWPPRMRGLGVALTGLLNTFIGAVGGPLIIAWLTEHVMRDHAEVGTSIAVLVLPCITVASVLFWVAARTLRQEGHATMLRTG